MTEKLSRRLFLRGMGIAANETVKDQEKMSVDEVLTMFMGPAFDKDLERKTARAMRQSLEDFILRDI